MPALNKRLQVVGIGKQSAKGTAATNPDFAHGIESGTVGNIPITQDRAPLTSAYRASSYYERTESAGGGGDFSMRAHAKSIGLWLYGALGGKAVTGAGPYTHTFTDATSLPYLTLFDKKQTSIINAIKDCRVDKLEFSWDKAGAVKVDVGIMGTTPDFAATFTPVVDDQEAAYFLAGGGTFKLDTDSATPVTAKVTSGKISIQNGIEPVQLSASILPDEQMDGQLLVDWELTVVPDTDLADWRTVVTGSSSGTTISEAPVLGSGEVQFNQSTNSLKFTSTRVAWLADIPESDAAGGPVELALKGQASRPSGGNTLTAVLVNGQATY